MGAVVVAARYVPRPPDDQPWIRKSYGPSLVLELASNLPFRATRWRFDYDQQREWVGGPQSAFNLLSQTLQLYAPAPARNPPYAETPEWGVKSGTVNNLLLNAAITPPLVPTRWKFDYDQSAYWVNESTPVSAPLLTQLLNNVPFKPPYWKYNNDDPGAWNGKPSNVNRVIDLAFVAPFVPSQWKFDYNDAAVWFTRPGNIPASYMPVGGGYPFPAVRWRFNYDDQSLWNVESFPKPPVQSLIPSPFTPNYWRFNYDDASVPGTWTGGPSNVSILQQLVTTNPLLPQRWKFDYNDASFWSGSPSDVPITITQPLPPVPPPARGVGWPTSGGEKRWWEELQEEYAARWLEEHPEAKPSKAKEAVKARKTVVRQAAEALDQGLLSELNAAPLAELVAKTVTAPKLTDALGYAQQVRDYIDRLREADDEEDLLLFLMALDD